tara:strand:+ start:5899 stop:7056 length:1158 start_codon:yes stop_codon:yes gene_type:complete
MLFKTSKLIRFLSSIKSVIYINLFIKLKKLFNKEVKIVFFYFPVKSYQDNILDLINEIRKEKNIQVINGYNLSSSEEIKKHRDAFFLNLGYLKYIKNIDIFCSSYVVYDFPDTLNKIYINHDIYDTPMVSPEKEKNLIYALNKCNYIFLSSDIALDALDKKINKYTEKKTSLINTGYLKLDHVCQKLENTITKEDAILLAPTFFSMLKNYNLDEYLSSIINEILNKNHLKLIYRPHPGDKKDKEKSFIIKSIYEKFKSNNNFFLDDNISYIESYKKSKILITDFSGTAYTYAFSKLRPIIFFSKNEIDLLESDLSELYFFKDREDVGKIVQSVDNLNEEIYSLEKKITFYSEKIKKLRSKRIKFFNCSMQQNLLNFKNILNIEKK